MSDPGLTIDQRGLRTTGGRLRTYLPDDLVARYEPIHNLNVSAGQADLVVARVRSSGEEVVVKLYRHAEQLDREVMERLYEADNDHVVRLIEHGETDGEPWEVQEYCALGTLTDYRLEQGGQLSEPQARAAVKELADAIHHIHSLNITHRDLKPENILVRSLDPLDLVLTDFGVAAEQIATVQLQTVAASWVWAAPEVHTKGAVSRDIDWWAMGAIVHQLLTGRHPLSGSDGRLPGDLKVIRAGVVDGLYSTEAIVDERWRALTDGLLSYEPSARWAYEQVSDWLNGQNPNVVRTAPLAEQFRAAKNAPIQETREHMFIWDGEPIRTGRELVLAMRAKWGQATEYLNTWPEKSLVDWLLTRPDGQVISQVMDLEANGAGRLIRLQAKFDPDGSLEFQGRPVSDESLNQAIKAVDRWSPPSAGDVASQHEWLGAIRDQHVLKSIAAAVESDSARLIRADQLLNEWSQAAARFLSAARERVETEQSVQSADAAERRFLELEGSQFSVALSGSVPSRFGDQARNVASAIQRTLDALSTHELLPKASPWAKGQRARDTLLSLATQVVNEPQENLGIHIPASIYLEMMDQACSHDLATIRAEAKRIKREREDRIRAEREARERAEREARERAEREARLAVERAEAERKRLEEATKAARIGAKKWWEERLVEEQLRMQVAEDGRTEAARSAKQTELERKRDWEHRDSLRRASGWIATAKAKKQDRLAKVEIDEELARFQSKQIRLVRIPMDSVRAVIGKGGQTIKRITDEGVKVEIEGWHEAEPWSRRVGSYTRPGAPESVEVRIERSKWKAGEIRERPWIRPKKAGTGLFSYVFKSSYWTYVDEDFLSKDSRQRYDSYRDDSYSPTEDDQWYSSDDAYEDTRKFDDFGGFTTRSWRSGYETHIHDYWDWFETPASLPPAPTPPTKTVRGKDLVLWKLAHKDAVEDYKQIRSEYERIFNGPTKGHGGIVVAVVTGETAVAADQAVSAIQSAIGAPARGSARSDPAKRSPSERQPIFVGQEFTGTIRNITDFGAFVELVPGVDGLLHISELKSLNNNRRVESVSDVLRVGQSVKVTVHQVKDGGKYSLKLVQ